MEYIESDSIRISPDFHGYYVCVYYGYYAHECCVIKICETESEAIDYINSRIY